MSNLYLGVRSAVYVVTVFFIWIDVRLAAVSLTAQSIFDMTSFIHLKKTVVSVKEKSSKVEKLQESRITQVEKLQESNRTHRAIVEGSLDSLRSSMVALDSNIKRVNSRFNSLPSVDGRLGEFHQQFEKWQSEFKYLQEARIHAMSQTLSQYLSHSQYHTQPQFFFTRDESMKLLLTAFRSVQTQLILVNPWPAGQLRNLVDSPYLSFKDVCPRNVINIPGIRHLLERGVRVCIGWGYYNDLREGRIKPDAMWKYQGFKILLDLKEKYPNFEMKVFNTHQKFFVCDKELAVLTTHNFFSSAESSDQREAVVSIRALEDIKAFIHYFNRTPHDKKAFNIFQKRIRKAAIPQLRTLQEAEPIEGNSEV